MKIAYILMGLPCSGKTTYIEEESSEVSKKIKEGAALISADKIKETHPHYNPEKAYLVHAWSVKEAYNEVEKICKAKKRNLVFDGGGINNNYTKNMINMIKKNNYHVILIHIKTPLSICLERNKLRERKVPEINIKSKAAIENRKFNEIKLLADVTKVVNYYTRKHIFFDMDGVLAGVSRLTRIDGEIDFLNSDVHKYLPKVNPVINKAEYLLKKGRNIYILSATPNNFCADHKNEWLDRNVPFIDQKNRYYVNSGRNIALMLDHICRLLKLNKKDVVLIEDTFEIIDDCYHRGIDAVHVSEFLTTNF